MLGPHVNRDRGALDTIDVHEGCGVTNLRFVCLVASPEGIERLKAHHPEVPIWTAAIDERLNEHGYIVPGLGDAGDRLYGTR